MKKLTRYALAIGIGAGVGCAAYYLNKYKLSYTVSVEKSDDFCWLPTIKITKEQDDQPACEPESESRCSESAGPEESCPAESEETKEASASEPAETQEEAKAEPEEAEETAEPAEAAETAEEE